MTSTTTFARVPAMLILMVLAGTVQGQTSAGAPGVRRSPGNDPVLSDPGIERELRPRDRESEPVMPTPVKPSQKAIPSMATPVADAPGLSGVDFSLPKRVRYPEGTFIPTSLGRMIKARTGDVIFLPDTREGMPPEPPMVLMRSQKLSQIEAALSSPGFSGRASVGGQVFVYRDQHYLLPTVFAAQSADEPGQAKVLPPESPAAPVGEKAADGKPQEGLKPAPADAANDPRVEDLIKDLEAQRSVPRALTPNPAPTTAKAPAATPVRSATNAEATTGDRQLIPEGTNLVFRRGRLVRLSEEGGRIAFAFDNDPNSPAPAPMIIQPSAQLQRLEGLVAVRGDAMTLKASGRVLTYQGRNYLLPTFVQVVSTGEVVPMQ
jgi:hypothetical protein